MTIEELKAQYAVFLREAARAINEDQAAAQQQGANPYQRFLLPSSVANYTPSDPPYDLTRTNEVIEAALDEMEDSAFIAILDRAVSFGLSILPGT